LGISELPKGKRPLIASGCILRSNNLKIELLFSYNTMLVAKGYTQRKDINYNEVFSPIVKHYLIRILLALVAQYDFEMDQLGVKIAFLEGDIDEEILMTHPMWFKAAGKENLICKLKKSLYEVEATYEAMVQAI